MTRTEWMKTDAARELANTVRRNCRGTLYRYTAASEMKHVDCIRESSEFSGIYTCHTHKVQGIG